MLVVLYGLGRHFFVNEESSTGSSKIERSPHLAKKHSLRYWQNELARVETPEYLHDYIVRVIKHGSQGLGFPGGVMEGGYVPKEVAPMLACYVMELGGHSCPRPVPKEASMYFSSSCAGCHGNDAKGIHGTYPDLTRPELLGITKRKEFLKEKIAEFEGAKKAPNPPKNP